MAKRYGAGLTLLTVVLSVINAEPSLLEGKDFIGAVRRLAITIMLVDHDHRGNKKGAKLRPKAMRPSLSFLMNC